VTTPSETDTRRPIAELPDAAQLLDGLPERIRGRRVAVFLDYDGVLSPIASEPDLALLAPVTRDAVVALGEVADVAVISGRDLDDVRTKVGVGELAYAGSHGFDLRLPDGRREQQATDVLPALDAAQVELTSALELIAGVRIERKRFAIAVHDRQVAEDDRDRIRVVVGRVAAEHPSLVATDGKRIHELRPTLDWDKGRAVERLLELWDQDHGPQGPDRFPVYLGDDVTDEDGFRAVLARDGMAVVVSGEADERLTLAQASLASPEEVAGYLDALRQAAAARPAGGS
jgi:trehalose 6-phosphate phosphatase